MDYTVDYFINKFEAIPEELWCVGAIQDSSGRRCAMGHCTNGTSTVTKENSALLCHVFNAQVNVPDINNGNDPRYQQPTPKQRILAALYDIKKSQEPEVKERIVYVTVDAPVRELQKSELIEN